MNVVKQPNCVPRVLVWGSRLLAVACLSFALSVQAYTVIIDPGHGGHDGGAVSGHAVEKALTLDTCMRFAGELRRLGVPYVFTRSMDQFVALSTRRNASQRYRRSVFVSIHFNASPNKSAHGIETFYRSAESRELASLVQASLIRQTGAVNRGVKSRGFTVITNNRAQASILVEGGFLTNPMERRRCMDPAYRQRLARAIAEGVVQALGRDRHVQPPPQRPVYAQGPPPQRWPASPTYGRRHHAPPAAPATVAYQISRLRQPSRHAPCLPSPLRQYDDGGAECF